MLLNAPFTCTWGALWEVVCEKLSQLFHCFCIFPPIRAKRDLQGSIGANLCNEVALMAAQLPSLSTD